MIQTFRMAGAVVGQLGRAAVGAVGIVLVIAAVSPTPGPGDPAGPVPGHPEPPVDTVAMKVPEGVLTKSLTITDASGCELAMLTLWHNGSTAVVARRRSGPIVSYWLDRKDRAIVEVNGKARRTRIEVDPDGTMKSFSLPKPGYQPLEPIIDGSPAEKRMDSLLRPLFFLWPICTFANRSAVAAEQGLACSP